MENMVVNTAFWQGKRVVVTGHTGFKGAWLSLWLKQLGAKVTGVSLLPASQPNLFEIAGVSEEVRSIIGDIRDIEAVKQVFFESKPEIVIHMAAQALVRDSYKKPVETYGTNVMGTLHILEAARACGSVKSVVIVTTDKCYENKECERPYCEDDVLGGYDIYSSSKACVELLVDSYRKSYLLNNQHLSIATARAGNVIGGGDWATGRLIPDIIRAFNANKTVTIRNPNAMRPWQHVLEPLFGYLLLAENLYCNGLEYAEAWNFGPQIESSKPVKWIVENMARYWNVATWEIEKKPQLYEAQILILDSTKAHKKLGWKSCWTLSEALELAVSWYFSEQEKMDMKKICYKQINTFEKANGQNRT